MTRLAIVGAGLMGEAILSGLRAAGWGGTDIVVCDQRAQRVADLRDRYDVRGADLAEAVADARTVLIAVKPADVTGVLATLRPLLADGALVLSVCAGVTLETLEGGLDERTPVIRAMPNTPARVGQGITALSPGAHATDEHLTEVTEILGAVGQVVTVAEKHQDSVTAVSGSGPAYLFLVAEALIEGGVHAGLSREVARDLAVQTLYGSAALLRESGEHPALLREAVTSPGGTTAAALRALEDHGVRAAFLAAVEAARDRSLELG
ncbi:pyrroline-5-carboxylate reductase [Granulicoccus sp. GXG6511]|uniref:pyrroline-5-carboxylate reductase n=1 Tax=Granulicoccus sp. GXG6511 TaxID=3381351 RepID=UPI003D7C72A7